MNEYWSQRTDLLLGKNATSLISEAKVIVFGVGGVGSWCVESLIRSGVKNITLVDPDCVAITNINRQLPATHLTIGQPKVEVMKTHILSINPEANVETKQMLYNEETAKSFVFNNYDIVIDAIDSLKDKALLIIKATESSATLFSSMGAALKLDPQRIHVAEFWKVKGCPLAAALRHRFKRNKTFPIKKFKCVYSEELIRNPENNQSGINGSIMHATAIFGLNLAALAINHIISSPQEVL